MAFFFVKEEYELDQLDRLSEEPVLGLDIETAGANGLIPQQSRIRLIQLSGAEDCFVVDLDRVNAMPRLQAILESAHIVKVIHNAKFEVKHLLHHFGVEIRSLFCTMLASQLLAKGRPMRHSLAEVTRRVLGVAIDKSLQRSDWSGALSEAQIQYAATDAELMMDLYPIMSKQLKEEKLQKVSQLEFRAVVPVAAMELKGIYVDRAALTSVKSKMVRDCQILEEQVLQELHSGDALPGMNVLNINAPEQVKQALLERGINVKDTSDSTLRPLIGDYPFVGCLLDYRHKMRIISSTLKPLDEAILPETGRVHSSYHQIASASGRFACSEPNIQQVPREREVRACIKPELGYRYIIADYSQVELRVAAGLSRDPIMLKAYAAGGDLHRLTAALTMGKPLEQVTKEERQAAKAINFGLIYAMGPAGLQASARSSYGVELTLEEATRFRDRYFENYQGIRQWQQKMERMGRARNYVRTAAGRIRSYQGQEIRVTELFNTPVQGTAAEGLKSAMCIFWDGIKKADLDGAIVAIIHDEIIVEVREDQTREVKQLLEESMVKGIQWLVPGVPFEAEAEVGGSWAEK